MRSPDYSPGQLIGNQRRYRLGKILGSGGMGQVFLAKDKQLGKQVALKLLHSTLSQDTACKKRFEREVSVCTALKSEHIVQIDDVDITTEGYPFFVMELLEGETLAQRLTREEFLSIPQSINIIVQVCSGLAIAHQGVRLCRDGKATEPIKVVHRDLKPENIFLVSTASGYLVKILDFGIAKLAEDQQAQYTGLTHTNSFIGTYEYASPEQIRGDSDIDERSDIYSLGMLLYRMLTGVDPFGLWQRNQRAVGAWALAHELMPPEPLRSHPHCQAYPNALELVVMQCLAKSPCDRFASVGELSQALQVISTPEVGRSPGNVTALDLVVRRALSNPERQGQSAALSTCYPPTLLGEAKAALEIQKASNRRKMPALQMIGAGIGGTLLLAGAGFGMFRADPDNARYAATKTRPPQEITVQAKSERQQPKSDRVQVKSKASVTPIAQTMGTKTDIATPSQGTIAPQKATSNIASTETISKPTTAQVPPAPKLDAQSNQTTGLTPRTVIAANGTTSPPTPLKPKLRPPGTNTQNRYKRTPLRTIAPQTTTKNPQILVVPPPIRVQPPEPETESNPVPPKMAQGLATIPYPKTRKQPIQPSPPPTIPNPKLNRTLRQVIRTAIATKLDRAWSRQQNDGDEQPPTWSVSKEPKYQKNHSKKHKK
jgi:serine/threonine protein kinase